MGVKKYFVYAQQGAMNKWDYFVVDVPGYVYGAGASETEAIQSAIRNGIPETEIEIDGGC